MRDPLAGLYEVTPEERAIDAALENWARWARPKERRMVSAMFKLYRRSGRAKSDYCLASSDPVKPAEAADIECRVSLLHHQAPQLAEVLRWYYVKEAAMAGWLAPMLGRRIAEVVGHMLTGMLRDARRRVATIPA